MNLPAKVVRWLATRINALIIMKCCKSVAAKFISRLLTLHAVVVLKLCCATNLWQHRVLCANISRPHFVLNGIQVLLLFQFAMNVISVIVQQQVEKKIKYEKKPAPAALFMRMAFAKCVNGVDFLANRSQVSLC